MLVVLHRPSRCLQLGPWHNSRYLRRRPAKQLHLPRCIRLLHSICSLGSHWARSHLWRRWHLLLTPVVLASRRHLARPHLVCGEAVPSLVHPLPPLASHFWWIRSDPSCHGVHLPLLGRRGNFLQRILETKVQGLVGQVQLHHVCWSRHGLVHLDADHLFRSDPAAKGESSSVVYESAC